MLCIVSALGMRAQTWTASEVGAGQFVLYNVGAGQYFTRGNGWGTQASITENASPANALTLTLELVGDKYKLRTDVNGSGYGVENLDGGTVYTDQSRGKNSTWTFTQVTTNNGPVYNIVSADNHGGGAGAFLAANADNTIVGPGTDGTSPYAKWKLLEAAKVPLLTAIEQYQTIRATVMGFAANTSAYTDESGAVATLNTTIQEQDAAVNSATTVEQINNAISAVKAAGNTFLKSVIVTSGFDITNAWITNPAPYANGDGWTATNGTRLNDWASNPVNYDSGNQCAEMWSNQGASIKQTLYNLPAGVYTLTAIAATREGMVSILSAGDASMNIVTLGSSGVNSRGDAKTWFDNGNGVNKLNFQLNDDTESLEIKLAAGDSGDAWTLWRSFTLTYYGDPINLAKAELAAAVAAAEEVEGTVPDAIYQTLAAVVTEQNKTYSTVDDYTAATEAIVAATNTAKAWQVPYNRYKSIRDAALSIAPETETDEADAAVEAASTTQAIDGAIATLRAAFLAELPNVTVPEAGLDVTAVMVDNAGVHTNTDYWTITEVNETWGNVGVCNYGECEFYNHNFKFYQTLALTPGTWEFGVTGFHRAGNHSTYFYAGEDKILIPGVESSVVNDMAGAKTYFDNGNGKVALKFLIENTGNVEIGIDNKDTETDKWTIFRDFTLKYFGAPDYSIYEEQLAALAATAAELEGNIPSAAYTVLNNVVTENNKTYTTKTDYLAAIANIEAAVAAANPLQAPYAVYKTLKPQVEAMMSVEGYTEANNATATLTSAIANIVEIVEGASAAETVTEQNDALKTAAMTFLADVRSDGTHPFDITFMITNPNFDNNNIDGWTRTFDGGTANTRCHSNEFYDNNSFDFNQTLTNMPKGNYELKVQAFQRPGYAGAAYDAYIGGNTSTDAVVYINDGETAVKHIAVDAQNDHLFWENEGNYPDDSRVGPEGAYKYVPNSMEGAEVWFAAGHYDNSILTAVDGTLKLGFKADKKTAEGTWTLFDNFRLYFYGNSINVTMDEAVAFSALADIEGANVTMTRTTKVGLNTIALPFDLDETQVKAIFGDDAIVYAYSDEGEADATTVNFNTAETKIVANVPVLVNVTKASAEIKVDNVTVKTGEAKAEGKNFDFVGNYAGQVTIAAGDWFVSGGKLYESKGTTTIKGFRAYLKDKNPDTTGEVKLYIDGVATAISEINADVQESGLIYNLAGQRVSKTTRGIYVKNGRKVVVK